MQISWIYCLIVLSLKFYSKAQYFIVLSTIIFSVKVVTINLEEDIFTPGKKYYERVRTCLEKNLGQQFNVIVAWDPPGQELCPSSVAAWFHNRGCKVSLCRQKLSERIVDCIAVPTLDEHRDFDKIMEWIGILSVGGDMLNDNEENYVNSYRCPSPSAPMSQVGYFECTGFITRSKVMKIFEKIKDFVRAKEALGPWLSLHVHGFADSPVNWDLKEHTFFMDGDNSCTILFQSTGEYIIQKSLSSNNKPRINQ